MPIGQDYQNRDMSRFGFSFMQSEYRQSAFYNDHVYNPLEDFSTDSLKKQFSPIPNFTNTSNNTNNSISNNQDLMSSQDLGLNVQESSTDSTKSPDYQATEKRTRVRLTSKNQNESNFKLRQMSTPDNSASSAQTDESNKKHEKNLSRASYMCRKCKAHGVSIAVKQHKKDCQFSNCKCVKCQLVEKGRQVVARQIALYRDQKAVNDGKTTKTNKQMLSLNDIAYNQEDREQSLLSQSFAKSSWSSQIFPNGTDLHNELSLERMLQASNENGDVINNNMALALFQRNQNNYSGEFEQSDNNRIQEGPHCRRCRNHNVAVTWRGHKKNCPYRTCTCGPCKLINERKDTEKTLRDMLGFEEEKSTGFSNNDNRSGSSDLEKLSKSNSSYFRNEQSTKTMHFQPDMLLRNTDVPFNLSTSNKQKDKTNAYNLSNPNSCLANSNRSNSDLELDIENTDQNFYSSDNIQQNLQQNNIEGMTNINKFSSFWNPKYSQNISNRMMSIQNIPEELYDSSLLQDKYPIELAGYANNNMLSSQNSNSNNSNNNTNSNNTSQTPNYFNTINTPVPAFYDNDQLTNNMGNNSGHIGNVNGNGLCCHDNVSAVAMAAAAATAAMVAMAPPKNCYHHYYYHHHHEYYSTYRHHYYSNGGSAPMPNELPLGESDINDSMDSIERSQLGIESDFTSPVTSLLDMGRKAQVNCTQNSTNNPIEAPYGQRKLFTTNNNLPLSLKNEQKEILPDNCDEQTKFLFENNVNKIKDYRNKFLQQNESNAPKEIKKETQIDFSQQLSRNLEQNNGSSWNLNTRYDDASNPSFRPPLKATNSSNSPEDNLQNIAVTSSPQPKNDTNELINPSYPNESQSYNNDNDNTPSENDSSNFPMYAENQSNVLQSVNHLEAQHREINFINNCFERDSKLLYCNGAGSSNSDNSTMNY